MTRSDVLRSAGAIALLLMIGCAQAIPYDPPGRETVLEERRLPNLLVCSPDMTDDQTIRPGHGPVHLRTGSHEVRIPAGWAQREQQVRLQLEYKDTVSVRLEGDAPLSFSPPARLYMSIAHCSSAQKNQTWYIWRRGEGNAQDQKLQTQRNGDVLWAWISRASVFMIAN